MSVQRERRIERVTWIKRELVKLIEKEKKDKLNNDEFIAEIMMRFMVSKRIAIEDVVAAKIFLRF